MPRDHLVVHDFPEGKPVRYKDFDWSSLEEILPGWIFNEKARDFNFLRENGDMWKLVLPAWGIFEDIVSLYVQFPRSHSQLVARIHDMDKVVADQANKIVGFLAKPLDPTGKPGMFYLISGGGLVHEQRDSESRVISVHRILP